jgi:hypothetical protein
MLVKVGTDVAIRHNICLTIYFRILSLTEKYSRISLSKVTTGVDARRQRGKVLEQFLVN